MNVSVLGLTVVAQQRDSGLAVAAPLSTLDKNPPPDRKRSRLYCPMRLVCAPTERSPAYHSLPRLVLVVDYHETVRRSHNLDSAITSYTEK